jgi:hypothetical protein
MIEALRANSVPRRGIQLAALPRTRKQAMPFNGEALEGIQLAAPRRHLRVTRKRLVRGFHTLYKSVNPRTREMASGLTRETLGKSASRRAKRSGGPVSRFRTPKNPSNSSSLAKPVIGPNVNLARQRYSKSDSGTTRLNPRC